MKGFLIVLSIASLFLSGCAVISGGTPASKDTVSYQRSYKMVFDGSNERIESELSPEKSLSGLDFELTPEVNAQIKRLVTRERSCIETSMERRKIYFSTMASAFKAYGVPLELINVGLVESGFNPDAGSPAGAKGIWQFMKPTARVYGLKVDATHDERRNPEKSSRAAARHLRDLYLTYGDWYLALAAYNSGSAAIDRAINKSGYRNFWDLSRNGYLHGQTREYVPRVIAAAVVMDNLERYGFAPDDTLYAFLKESRSTVRE